MPTYSDTVHGRFIEHMDLARAWVRYLGVRDTEVNVIRLKNRKSASELRQLLAERGVKVA